MFVVINTIIITIIIVVTLLIVKDLIYEDRQRKINKLLPGPKGVIVFGNLLQINLKDVASCFDKLYKEYGPIYRLRLGNVETVVLSGGQVIDECYIKNKFKFQERYVRLSRTFSKDLDILYSNGDYWHALKNTVLTEITIRKLNSGRLKVNNYVLEMIKKIYVSNSNTVENVPFYIREFILKLILDFVFGNNININNSSNNQNNNNSNNSQINDQDELIKKFINIIARLFRTASTFIYSDYIPLLLPMDLVNMTKGNMISDFLYLKSFSNNILNKYKEKLNKESNNNNNNNNSDYYQVDETVNQIEKPLVEHCYDRYLLGEIKYESILFVAVDFMIAGLDTTANTLSYIIIALINNPEVQEKLYQEIKSNKTQDNVSYGDHHKYPYTNAVIKESHRYFAVVPISEPTITTEDVEIQVNNINYKIAKGTQVIKNIRSTHLSNSFWDCANIFQPERFLNNISQHQQQPQQQTYQFGAGIRKCIGFNFAESILFNSLVLLVKNFQFINPDINKPINENGDVGLAMQCKEFSAIFKKRV